MAGSDRQRHCGACKREVFNLSAMSEAEAAAFLEAAAALPENADKPCVSLFQRTDGTVLTADCPVGLSRRRRRAILASTLPLGAAAVVALTALGGVLGMMQHPAAKVEDEPAPAFTVPAVLTTPPIIQGAQYMGVIETPTPSYERDRPEGVHVAGGLRAYEPPPTVKTAKPPTTPKPPHRKVAAKRTHEPTSAEILEMLEQERGTL